MKNDNKFTENLQDKQNINQKNLNEEIDSRQDISRVQEQKKEKQESTFEEKDQNLEEKDQNKVFDKIKELEDKILILNDKLLRAVAETENVRRRGVEETSKAHKYAISNFAKDLILTVDNLFLAADNLPKEVLEINKQFKDFADAVLMTKNELLKTLEKHQIKRINPVNERFDLNYHEAISSQQINEGEDIEDGTITKVFQAGYVIADRVIRPALVSVAKK